MPIMYLTATIYKQLFKPKVEIHVAKKPVPIYESEGRGSSDISVTFMKAAPKESVPRMGKLLRSSSGTGGASKIEFTSKKKRKKLPLFHPNKYE